MESPDDHEMFRKVLLMMFGGIITMLNNVPTQSSVSKIVKFTRPVDGVITDNFT
ncbi:hypothetical protein RvY_10938 [Ramazzottius varieornatus]|uniref:Uncharacterized protein n=1 Tax=Ramazzottius varieornatus TaxID=947166 RepID=A0A1D1VM84_RAMVA|nr:hypothetical protein RvY_10938 [Ramazzottius varieornatus]